MSNYDAEVICKALVKAKKLLLLTPPERYRPTGEAGTCWDWLTADEAMADWRVAGPLLAEIIDDVPRDIDYMWSRFAKMLADPREICAAWARLFGKVDIG